MSCAAAISHLPCVSALTARACFVAVGTLMLGCAVSIVLGCAVTASAALRSHVRCRAPQSVTAVRAVGPSLRACFVVVVQLPLHRVFLF